MSEQATKPHLYNESLEEGKYKVYKSSAIVENHGRVVDATLQVHKNLKEYLSLADSDNTTTWRHSKYNFWTHSMMADPIFISIWEDLVEVVKANSPDRAKYAWIQSWLNYDTHDSVEKNLKHHGHNSPIHGYISIDPGNTKTVFDEWDLVNEIGNIYVGLGKWMHHVENLEEYDTPRLTIGYDIVYGDGPGEGWEVKGYQSLPWHPHWIPIILD